MSKLFFASIASLALLSLPASVAHGAGRDTMTLQEALDSAERLLDNGGDASDIAGRLHKSRGLNKEEQRRLELIDARCALLTGASPAGEKILARLYKAAPDDARLAEWYARALDGSGKGEVALPLLKDLAAKDGLKDGDSYWALAQLERKGGDRAQALAHARAALTHPIVLQSDELDKEIHKFIAELSKPAK